MSATVSNQDFISMLDQESSAALQKFVEALFQEANRCSENPTEQSAVFACKVSRYVADTVESIMLNGSNIESQLLTRAIEGIQTCINAVSEGRPLKDSPPALVEHVERMLKAMTVRRDDLTVLLHQGRTAYFERRQNQLAEIG